MTTVYESKSSSIDKLCEGLLNYADSFSFVIRKETAITKNIQNLISDLSDYHLETTTVTQWPGTKLFLGEAMLYSFNFNLETAFVLSNYQNNLFKWLSPDLPEDLVFYKKGRPIFVSITHEHDAYFELDSAEASAMKKINLI